MNEFTYTLKNGLKLTGPYAQVAAAAAKFGESISVDDGIHYLSQTHGLLRIADMSMTHTRNAIAKMLREQVAALEGKQGAAFYHAVRALETNKTIEGLITRYGRGINRGEM